MNSCKNMLWINFKKKLILVIFMYNESMSSVFLEIVDKNILQGYFLGYLKIKQFENYIDLKVL